MDQPAAKAPKSPRVHAFVREYLVDRNATQAAQRAGYSKKSAYQQGAALLKTPWVKAQIAAADEKLQEKALITAEYIDRALVEVVERSLQRVPVREFNPESRTMEQVVEQVPCDCGGEGCKKMVDIGLWEYDSSGVTAALGLMAKRTPGYLVATRAEVTGKNGKPLVAIPPEIKALAQLDMGALEKLIEATK